jgi:uncharacterized membrane protein
MKISRSTWLLLIGFFCVLIGAVLPWLMVLQILESTFFLNFFSFAASVVGLFLGIIGASERVMLTRKKYPRNRDY